MSEINFGHFCSEDCYPDTWQSGRPSPNLQSFGEDVVRAGVHNRRLAETREHHGFSSSESIESRLFGFSKLSGVDCFLFGSRGGQVVLPILWQALRNASPPSWHLKIQCATDSLKIKSGLLHIENP